MNTVKCWQFAPLDTLFFRDGRPFNAGETVWLNSQFPPSGRTLQGAIRSAIVEHSGMDWISYRAACKPENAAGDPLVRAIGTAQDLGEMRLSGPFLLRDREWLLPVPLDLFVAQQVYGLLAPSATPVECDLGAVRLPQASVKGLKTQEGKYVTVAVMAELLAGQTANFPSKPSASLWKLFADNPDDPEEKDALADLEPKVGLGRDNVLRLHKEGMLYSIATVRLREGVTLAMVVAGIDEKLHPSGPFIQRLGGEGKLAKVSISDPPAWPRMPTLIPKAGKLRFKLVLTTPTYFKECWRPDGFALRENVGWQGSWPAITTNQETIELANVTLVSACIGKTVRIGGWDLASNAPRPLEGFVPAGSVYFCEIDAGQMDNVAALHGGHIGLHREYGFGHVLVGTWEESTL